jgi:hypothetical protein
MVSPCQLRRHSLTDFFDGVGFFDIFSGPQALGFFDAPGFRKAAGDDRLLVGPAFDNFLLSFQPVNSGIHDHVQHDEIDRVVLYIFDGFFSAGCGIDGIPQLVQHQGRDIALLCNVIHN